MIWNTFILALRGIRRNVMRSVLTILGIIIGVAAVITLVTIGNGTTAQVTQQIAAMGTNVLLINPGQRHGPGGASGAPVFPSKMSRPLNSRSMIWQAWPRPYRPLPWP